MALKLTELYADITVRKDQYDDAIAEAHSQMESLASQVRQGQISVDDFNKRMQELAGIAGKASTATSGAASSTASLGEAAAAAGGKANIYATAILAVATAMGAITVGAVKIASDIEEVSIAFNRLTGGANAAKLHIEELMKLSAGTQFRFGDVADYSMQLQQAGFTAKEVAPTLKAVADAAAGTGSGTAGASAIVDTLAEIRTQQQATVEDLDKLGERGVHIYESLGEQMGVSAEQAAMAVAAGAVSGEQAVAAAVEAMKEHYKGAAEEANNTLPGMMQNVFDKIQKVLKDLGEEILPYIKPALEWIMRQVDKLPGAFARFSELVKTNWKEIEPVLRDIYDGLMPIVKVVAGALYDGFVAIYKIGRYVWLAQIKLMKPVMWVLKQVGLLVWAMLKPFQMLISWVAKLIPGFKATGEAAKKAADEARRLAELEAAAAEKPPMRGKELVDAEMDRADAADKAAQETERRNDQARAAQEKREQDAQAALEKQQRDTQRAAEEQKRQYEQAQKAIAAAVEKRQKEEQKRQEDLKKAAEQKRRAELDHAEAVLDAWKQQQDEKRQAALDRAGKIGSVDMGGLWQSAMIGAARQQMLAPAMAGTTQPDIRELQKISDSMKRQERQQQTLIQIVAERLGTFR